MVKDSNVLYHISYLDGRDFYLSTTSYMLADLLILVGLRLQSVRYLPFYSSILTLSIVKEEGCTATCTLDALQ